MKKTWDVIKNVLSWIVTVIAVVMMLFTIISTTTFNRNDRNIFGYKFFIVLSDSMKATDFEAGDVVVSKYVDPSTLQEGDIITYQSQNTDNYGEVVTHKIRTLTTDAEGNPGFITYGTTTGVDDETVVTYSFVLGQYQFRVPKLGLFFQFLKSVPGYFVCIFVPFAILIIIQASKSIKLFKLYKKEQNDAIEAEKASIAEEKAKNELMMEQLLAMQAQLAAQGVTVPQAPPAAEQPAEAKAEEAPAE